MQWNIYIHTYAYTITIHFFLFGRSTVIIHTSTTKASPFYLMGCKLQCLQEIDWLQDGWMDG